MKIGDLVEWAQAREDSSPSIEQRGGIIMDGPRKGYQGTHQCQSYAVHWFAHDETMWHNDHNLEVISERQ